MKAYSSDGNSPSLTTAVLFVVNSLIFLAKAVSRQANGQLEHMHILEIIMALLAVAIWLLVFKTYYYYTLKLLLELCGLSIGKLDALIGSIRYFYDLMFDDNH